MSKWQPIETAPQNGSWVLGYFLEYSQPVQLMKYDAPRSGHKPHWNVGCLTLANPLYWMPLPEDP